MSFLNCCSSSTLKKGKSTSIGIGLLQLRLSEQEIESYTNLFNQHKIEIRSEFVDDSDLISDEKINVQGVIKKEFPYLLGMIGTDIAEEFAFSIFNAISSKSYVTINEYLKYVDIYHHGDQNERSLITFKLIDKQKSGKVELDDFKLYLKLILSAIEKVQPSKEPLLNNKEIEDLFMKISNNKNYFNYEDFNEVFFNKPELVSWIDYFKNNDDDIIGFMNSNVKQLLVMFFKFFYNLSTIINVKKQDKEGADGISFELEKFGVLITEIEKFNKKLKKRIKLFSESNYFNNIRSVFDTFTSNTEKNENDKKFNTDIHKNKISEGNNEQLNTDKEKTFKNVDIFHKISSSIMETKKEIYELKSRESK